MRFAVESSQQRSRDLPQKIRELLKAIKDAGFTEIGGGCKGFHRKFTHPEYCGAVTMSGKTGDDAKNIGKNKYQLPSRV